MENNSFFENLLENGASKALAARKQNGAPPAVAPGRQARNLVIPLGIAEHQGLFFCHGPR